MPRPCLGFTHTNTCSSTSTSFSSALAIALALALRQVLQHSCTGNPPPHHVSLRVIMSCTLLPSSERGQGGSYGEILIFCCFFCFQETPSRHFWGIPHHVSLRVIMSCTLLPSSERGQAAPMVKFRFFSPRPLNCCFFCFQETSLKKESSSAG